MSPLDILIVDDDAVYARLLAIRLEAEPTFRVRHLASGEAAVAAIRAGDAADLVLLDVMMPDQDGLETLKQLREVRPGLPVVMVSAMAQVQVALEAIGLGAADYLTKGQDDMVKVIPLARQIADRLALTRQVEGLRARLGGGSPRIIGESSAMGRIFRLVERAAGGDLATAVLGESGTGKELVAEAIHATSDRADGPFVVVNCAAIPGELMESEFFGHEKGAFTGAVAQRKGVFEQADGGTLFLDELCELDLGLQAKLLRTLQDGSFRRVGGDQALVTDVRVVSATNRDVGQMVRDGSFREDLYYRLFTFPIQLPPLRARDRDVILLAEHFLRAYAERRGFAPKPFSAAARRALLAHVWPGNVRELKAVVERAVLLADGAEIQPGDLMLGQDPLRVEPEATTPAAHVRAAGRPDEIVPMETLKRMALEHAYTVCGGHADHTAAALGITRSSVYRLLKKYGIAEPSFEA